MNDESFGTKRELTSAAAIQWLEGVVSEGFASTRTREVEPRADEPRESEPRVSELNLFGRPVSHFASNDLSSITGFSLTGLRAGALLSADAMVDQAKRLAKMARLLQPVVVYAPSHGISLADAAGAFCLQAADAQEALDLGLIAHKAAEEGLVPGIVAFEDGLAQEIALPERQALAAYLGEPDALIASPTPAQEMLFGPQRRRIPQWFNHDLPALIGAAKAPESMAVETAARQRFFASHLPELIRRVMGEFGGVFGRDYAPVGTYQIADAEYLFITAGAAFSAAQAAVDALRGEGLRVGCLCLRLLQPFPEKELAALLVDKKAVVLFQPIASAESSYVEQAVAAAIALCPQPPVFARGYYGAALASEEAQAALRRLLPEKASRALGRWPWQQRSAAEAPASEDRRFFLGLGLGRRSKATPQAELLSQELRRRYPGIEKEGVDGGLSADCPAGSVELALPQIVRRYRDQGPPYSQLARFYHDTVSAYGLGQPAELLASPFQAVPQTPAASALFAGRELPRESLPVFKPETCTGCGACTLACPHAAIPPIAIGVEGLVKGAMSMAAAQGRPLVQLTPLIKNLARLAGAAIEAAGKPVAQVADFLPIAFEQLLQQLKAAPEKETVLRREWVIALDLIGAFPLAATEQFYTVPESREKGSGAFFAVAINPYACTSCGRCAEACPEGAIEMLPGDVAFLERIQTNYDLWEKLPDTPAPIVERLVQDETCDPFAALLLSRHYYQSLAGGSLSEAGAEAKQAFHLAAALAESILQPRLAKLVQELEDLIGQLSANIHQQLSAAIPRQGFAPLEQIMAETGGAKLPLDELLAKLGQRERLELVDTAAMQRKLHLLHDLQALRWAITEGPTGTARARLGLLVQAGAWPWAERFPYNAFLHPALAVDADGAVALAQGVQQGQLRHALDQVRLLRRARLEAKGKYRPEQHGPEIAALRWEDLDEVEQALLPPLLLLAGPDWLDALPPRQLGALLASPGPLKILVFDEPHDSAALQALALHVPAGLIGQGSLVAPRELYAVLGRALASAQPALFRLLLAKPGEEAAAAEAIARWQAWQAALARWRAGEEGGEDKAPVEEKVFYQQKIKEIKQSYEAKLQEQESIWTEKTRLKLRERLLALAQRKT
jgi:pyruvate/2-oxoacid:ferredoxin oxidoreductase alpha subunit/ferredoxin